ncbi:hypothetical protein ACFQ3S_15155 [Mucilaginibacter terrae]|uniref:hypothetical protein n=1 Tax=Mucilaginibacter terrae TaxID=1955052 RepID=UPI0036258A2B
MKKQIVLEALNTLDDNFDTEQLVERLLFIEKVEKGLQDVSEGKVVSMDEVKTRFVEKWAK